MAIIDFPASPVDGQLFAAPNNVIYQWSALYTAWLALGGANSGAYVGTTPPTSPYVGQFWWSSETGALFIYYDDGNTRQWVPANPAIQPQTLLWRMITRIVPSAGQATIDINPGTIPADINSLMFEAHALPQTNDVGFFLRFNDGTGWDASAAYYSNAALSQSNVTIGGNATQTTDTAPPSGTSTNQIRMTYNAAGNGVSSTSPEGILVEGRIGNIRQTALRRRGIFSSYYWQANNNSMNSVVGGFSWQNTAGILQGLRFYFGTGNFAAGGAITLWGSP